MSPNDASGRAYSFSTTNTRVQRHPGAGPLLAADGITKRFDGIRALDDVTLAVNDGECVGLIGPNGAGKSTLFDCLTGRLVPDAGRVRFRGQAIDRRSGPARARMGLARTFQRVELFAGMTVADHLLVAIQARAGQARVWRDLLGRGRATEAQVAQVRAIAELVGLAELADRPVESLTLGQARLVELGRVLACDPMLLFLDEPSSGLDRAEAHAMADALAEVRQRAGLAILLTEHDVPFVRQLASRLYVLDAGRLLAEGPADAVLARSDVRTAYLGTPPDASGRAYLSSGAHTRVQRRSSRRSEDESVLELEGVSAAYGPFRALFDVDLEVPPHAAVALVGPNGAGKTTLARVCSGLMAPLAGRVRLQGEDVTGLPAHELAQRGVAHANEGRSVFASLTVEDNLVLAFRQALGNAGVATALDEAYELFGWLTSRRRQLAGSLSGGEQRMLSLARAVVRRPVLLIADELSMGLAPSVVDAVYEVLAQIRAGGTSIVVIEQQLDRALAFADDAVVLDTGEVTWGGPSHELDGDRAADLLHLPHSD